MELKALKRFLKGVQPSYFMQHKEERKDTDWLIDWLRPERMDEEWMNWLGMADDHSNYICIPVLYVNPELDFNQL